LEVSFSGEVSTKNFQNGFRVAATRVGIFLYIFFESRQKLYIEKYGRGKMEKKKKIKDNAAGCHRAISLF